MVKFIYPIQLSTKIFPKTKRDGTKNDQNPLLIRSEMEIFNMGKMPNPELLRKLFGWEYNLYITNYNPCI